MSQFADRFRLAVEYAGIEWSPTRLAEQFGAEKQTVHGWMDKAEPKAKMLFKIADTLRVDARWLATGEGTMVQPPSGPGLRADELELVKGYRKAPSPHRASMRLMAKTLAKGMLAAAFLLPTPRESEAAVLHNLLQSTMHICALWLRKFFLSKNRVLQV